jgi:hypothetical protein
MKNDKRLIVRPDQFRNKRFFYNYFLFYVLLLLICYSPNALAKEISLSWDSNENAVDGYNIYSRSVDGKYDYRSPILNLLSSKCTPESCETSVTIPDTLNVYFVVRAYSKSGIESLDSNEVFFDAERFAQGLVDLVNGETGESGIISGAVSGLSESLSKITETSTRENMDLYPAVEIFNNEYEHKEWLQIMWSEYMLVSGEARVAMGDIDGDNKDEIIIGLGPDHDPAIPGGLFQVLDDEFSHLAWGQIKWGDYNTVNGEAYPACGDIDGDGNDEIFIGLGDGGQGNVEVFDYQAERLSHKDWVQVDWPEYNQYLGITRPTCGDIDLDGKDEVIIGLGSDQSDPEMPAGLFQILDDDFSNLAWGEVDWPYYNSFNGETYPSCANLNGEGDNMIVVGLGAGGEGRMEIFQYHDGIASHKDWVTVDWEAYNQTVGSTRPVCGDIDGDGKDEIIIGLAANPDNPQIPGGLFPILDNDYTHLAWSEINWSDYNQGNGESFPASGDTNADNADEIFIGLGVRSAYALSGSGGTENVSAAVSATEEDKSGCFIRSVRN